MGDRTHHPPAEPALAPGKVVGGRFEIEAEESFAVLGALYRAKDRKTGRRVSVQIVGPGFFTTAEAHDLLRQAVRVASALTHRNIVATFGMGTEAGGLRYVAVEHVEGERLSDLFAARLRRGQGFSLRSAYNVAAHVLAALEHAHAHTLHAAIAPSVVLVARAGRVKVAGFGLLTALTPPERVRVLTERNEAAFLAPELVQGGAVDARADLYGVAGVLHALLTGRTPDGGAVRISADRGDVPASLDDLLGRALSPDPARRPPSAASFRQALREIVNTAAAGSDDGLDVDLSIEAEAPMPAAGASEAAAPGPAAPRVPAPGAPAISFSAPGAPQTPRVGDRVSLDQDFRTAAAVPSGAVARVDFDAILQDIGSQDAERWMVQKNKLDHGPFNARTLIQQILQGQVLEDDQLLNMDTGERRKIGAWPEFKEFVVRYKKQKAELEKKLALERAERGDKRSNFAKFVLAGGVVLVLGAGVALFLLTREAGRSGSRTPDELGNLFQPGRIEIQGTAGILPMSGGGGGGGARRGGRGGGGGGGGGGGSYEDAMNRAVSMGDVERGGGERQLTATDVARTLNGRLSMFRSCIVQEARTMPSTHACSMDIAIEGSGSVLGVSVTTGSTAFRSCVAAKVRSVRFPSFPAPRMGARFGFSW